jgi:hypothetical protein
VIPFSIALSVTSHLGVISPDIEVGAPIDGPKNFDVTDGKIVLFYYLAIRHVKIFTVQKFFLVKGDEKCLTWRIGSVALFYYCGHRLGQIKSNFHQNSYCKKMPINECIYQ